MTEEPGGDHGRHVPPGTPNWLIPALTIALATAAVIQLVVAASLSDITVGRVLSLVSGLMCLVLTVRMAKVWRQQRKDSDKRRE